MDFPKHMSAAARDCQRVTMNEFDAKIIAIANKAVKAAQNENRRLGIANVYSINGTIVWQLPDGTVTMTNPNT